MKILRNIDAGHDSLTGRVYRELRRAIITGRIAGGTRLVESALAAEMQVSRTPVREALHKLALEGLLHPIPRAGYIVEEMSEHDIQDLFNVRLTIEKIAAESALEHITDDELAALERNLRQTAEAIEIGLSHRLAGLDTEFHGILYKAARSRRLYEICRTLSDHSLKYRMALIHLPEMAVKTRDGHRRIFEALAARDKDGLNEALEAHLSLAQRDILALMARLRQESIASEDLRL